MGSFSWGVQLSLIYINRPEIARGFCGVGWEIPSTLLLVVTQLVDGAPEAVGMDGWHIYHLMH